MRLTVIGCSGSFPGPLSAASCYLLEDEHEGRTWRVLLDLGSGAFGTLQKYVDVSVIDALCFTHLHADHCLDLTGYYVVRRYHATSPWPRIPVYGPVGTAERMAKAYDLEPDPGMTEEFDFREWDGPITIGPFSIEPVSVAHPVTAFSLRIKAGDSILAYSGDTGPCEGLESAAEGADLFLAEASFVEARDNPPDLHLTGRQAGDVAKRAAVGRLVLTHIPPWHNRQMALDEAHAVFDGPINLAETGQVYEF
jgi:ribonuclease BN (tRNA processing enzyme)